MAAPCEQENRIGKSAGLPVETARFPTMLARMRIPAAAALLLASLLPTSGACVTQRTEAEAFAGSAAVAEIEVISSTPFETPAGTIATRLTVRPLRILKGDLPESFEIQSPGGTLGDRTELRSDSLQLPAGATAVLYLQRDAAGNWSGTPQETAPRISARGPLPAPSGIPGSVVTPTGYSETSGQPTRFTRTDGGAPIHYLIDIDPTKLPTGMTQAGAIAAVAEALAAWSGQSSLRFAFDGVVPFGTSASNVTIPDERLRIQLHDNFGEITNGSGTLGVGGGSFTSASVVSRGGKVGPQGFQERLYGYVVMESPANASSLNDIPTFKRVLTHEIGHSLGLAHSSENPSEPDPILKAATMYYRTGSGTAGATIQAYDVDRIQFGYPPANTPPYTTDRLIPAVTTGNPALLPTVPGVNRIRLRALDLQGTALTPILTDNDGGQFTLSGSLLTFIPGGYIVAPRLTEAEILNGTFYEKAYVQFSDGVNLSRAATCTVIGYFSDTTPTDGLPDDWMLANFGTKSVGAINTGRNPADDPDRDGLDNRTEFYLNTNPNSPASGPVLPAYNFATRQLAFTPVRFAPYAVESSTTLAPGSWTLRRLDTVYTVPGLLEIDLSDAPPPAREFYRLATGP